MKLLDKITTLPSSQQQSSSCPADMPNLECSLISELRELQKELNSMGPVEFEPYKFYPSSFPECIIGFRVNESVFKDNPPFTNEEIVSFVSQCCDNMYRKNTVMSRIAEIKKELQID